MNFLKNTIKEIPCTRSGQAELAEAMVRQVTDGEIAPSEAVVKAKALYEAIGMFLKDDRVTEIVLDECDRYAKGECPTFAGARVQTRETGVRWDYMNCGDPEYAEILKREQEISELRKKREKYLSGITRPKTELNEETGEVFTLNPPARSGKTSFVITYRKD